MSKALIRVACAGFISASLATNSAAQDLPSRAAPNVSRGAPAPKEKQGRAELLGDYLRRATAFGFSGAVAVIDAGRPVLVRGFGLADDSAPAPVTTHTPFYVASLSKQFTAAAILRLQSSGRLSIHDSIGRFFPGLPVDKSVITVEQLLHHTSGLAGGSQLGKGKQDEEGFVSAVTQVPLRSAPGTVYAYSNIGYAMLAAIVQQVSKQPFERFVQSAVMKPAGLVETDFVTAPTVRRVGGLTHAYRGYLKENDVYEADHRPYDWSERGAVGVVTTLDDMLRWENALAHDVALSRSERAIAWTPGLGNYGTGWVIDTTSRGTRRIHHDGLLLPDGWNADYQRFVDDSITVIVLSNRIREGEPLGWRASSAIERLLFGGSVVMPPSTSAASADRTRRPNNGVYSTATGAHFRISGDATGFLLLPLDQRAANLIAYDDPADSIAHLREDSSSSRVVAAMARGSLGDVRDVLGDGRTFEQWSTTLSNAWTALESRFGQCKLGGVRYGSFQDDSREFVNVFVRTSCERDTAVVVRLGWSKEKLVGISDMYSFTARAHQVEQVPNALPFRAAGPGRWVGFNLANGYVRNIDVQPTKATGAPLMRMRGPQGWLELRPER